MLIKSKGSIHMLSKQDQSGFTVVELLVVIIIVFILGALLFTISSGIQQRGRDTERQRDIKAIYPLLEAYYTQYTRYPTLSQLNNSSWRALNMKGLNAAVFQDPSGKSTNLVASPSSTAYSYSPKNASGKPCVVNTDTCTSYTLTALRETGNPFEVKNLAN